MSPLDLLQSVGIKKKHIHRNRKTITHHCDNYVHHQSKSSNYILYCAPFPCVRACRCSKNSGVIRLCLEGSRPEPPILSSRHEGSLQSKSEASINMINYSWSRERKDNCTCTNLSDFCSTCAWAQTPQQVRHVSPLLQNVWFRKEAKTLPQ